MRKSDDRIDAMHRGVNVLVRDTMGSRHVTCIVARGMVATLLRRWRREHGRIATFDICGKEAFSILMNYKCKWCGAERCGSSSRSRDRECYERVIKRLRERLKCIKEIATTRSDISVCARLVAINSVANGDDAAARVAERCAMLDRILESPFG